MQSPFAWEGVAPSKQGYKCAMRPLCVTVTELDLLTSLDIMSFCLHIRAAPNNTLHSSSSCCCCCSPIFLSTLPPLLLLHYPHKATKSKKLCHCEFLCENKISSRPLPETRKAFALLYPTLKALSSDWLSRCHHSTSVSPLNLSRQAPSHRWLAPHD